VYRTVAFLAEISSTALAYARQFELPLAAAEFRPAAKKNTAVVRFPVQSEAPVEEADRFSVFDSDGTPCGLFTVEVVCRAFFYGNLTSEVLECIMQNPQEFSARLQKSPRFHTSEAIRLLERDLAFDTVEEAGAMAWLVGLKECPFRVPDSEFPRDAFGLITFLKIEFHSLACRPPNNGFHSDSALFPVQLSFHTFLLVQRKVLPVFTNSSNHFPAA
jgi:hypothetical protein